MIEEELIQKHGIQIVFKIGAGMKNKKKIIKNNNIFYLNKRFKNIIKFIFLKMEVQSLENEAKNNVMEKFIKLIEKYPDKDWDWTFISRNPNLTMK